MMLFASLPTLTTTVVALLATSSTVDARELQAGDEICVEGYVMDFFCINRGTLFDNPSVVSLAEPERHSVHCLVDVAPCLASPYEVLYPLPEKFVTPDAKHSRGWRLDDPSKDKVLALARGVGRIAASPRCSTCTENDGGSLDKGFHAGMLATVVTTGTSTDPAIISVSRIEHSFPESPFCGVNGVGNTGLEPAVPTTIITTSGSNFGQMARIHGALMLIGWGILLPLGVTIAKFYRHRPDGWWFKVHRALQPTGLVFTIAGFAVALVNFDVFSAGAGISFVHGCLGATIMSVGLLQPLNAFVRPHPNQSGQPSNIKRTIWEYVHKGGGYGAVIFSVVQIIIGTTLLPDTTDQSYYQMAYGFAIGLLAIVAIFGVFEKRKRSGAAAADQMNPLMGGV